MTLSTLGCPSAINSPSSGSASRSFRWRTSTSARFRDVSLKAYREPLVNLMGSVSIDGLDVAEFEKLDLIGSLLPERV